MNKILHVLLGLGSVAFSIISLSLSGYSRDLNNSEGTSLLLIAQWVILLISIIVLVILLVGKTFNFRKKACIVLGFLIIVTSAFISGFYYNQISNSSTGNYIDSEVCLTRDFILDDEISQLLTLELGDAPNLHFSML